MAAKYGAAPSWWNNTITLFHRTEGKDALGKSVVTWHRTVLQNCFYGQKLRQRINGLEIVSSDAHVVRIPAAAVGEGFAIGKGDIIVLGDAPEELAVNDSGRALKETYAGGCFTVSTATDNTRLPRTAHWYASEGSIER